MLCKSSLIQANACARAVPLRFQPAAIVWIAQITQMAQITRITQMTQVRGQSAPYTYLDAKTGI